MKKSITDQEKAYRKIVDGDDVEALVKLLEEAALTVKPEDIPPVQFEFEKTQETYDPDEGRYWVSGRETLYAEYPTIHYAAAEGKIKVVKYLLSKGANPESIPEKMKAQNSDRDCQPPLMRAVIKKHPEVVKALIEKGAKVEFVNDRGYTPLMEAIAGNDLVTAQILLDHGANINYRSGHQDMIHLAYGALGSGTSRRNTSLCPIHVATADTLQWCVSKGAEIESVELYESHWNRTGPVQYTPLLFAVTDAHVVNVQKKILKLLALGANVYARTDTNKNIFDLLHEKAPSDVINALVLAYVTNIRSAAALVSKHALLPGSKPKPLPKPIESKPLPKPNERGERDSSTCKTL